MRAISRPFFPLLSLLFLGITHPLFAEDWPQFRGPNCTGISQAAKNLPEEFSDKKNVRWSVPLGDGVGCPVIASGRLFVSGMENPTTVALYAFQAADGKPLWKRTWPAGHLAEVHESNSHASTTPAADDKRVYFYHGNLGMIAVDAATGADAWQVKLPVPFYIFKWGAAMSPVLYKNLLIFCQDDDLHPALYAFDTKSGNIVWKDLREDQAVNYSHPVIAHVDGHDEIVIAGTGKVIGYDPANGQRLWSANVLLRNIKTTPVALGDTIYISLESKGIAYQWLETGDKAKTGNSDGKLTKKEMQDFVGKEPIPEEFFKRTFDRGDLNHDGFLEGAELDKAFLPPGNEAGARFDTKQFQDEFIMAVKAGGKGDVTKTHLLWKHPTKHTDHIVSPLVHDNRIFLVKGGGITTAFDAQKGEPIRKPTRIPNTSQMLASPVYGDGKIYIPGDNGVVVVVKDSPKYEVLGTNDLGEALIGTPAIGGDALYFRTRKKLFCIANSSPLAGR